MKALLLTTALAVMASAPALAKTIMVSPSADDVETLQTALIDAEPGDTVHIGAGTYRLSDGLSLDVDDVTVRGDGPGATILSFKEQAGAGEGLLVTSDRVLLTGFAVEDTKGDGIKAKGVDQVTFDNLRVEWTNGPDGKNGAYGLYPVESTNVLVQNSEVIACSDAGIYVGQSDNIVVRGNKVTYNVAGIEIENSTHADVYDNIAMHNTGGILVFDLPDLPKMGGHSTRIFDNVVVNNDEPNFAEIGNIVQELPVGTGIIVMANRNVHVFDNVLAGNQTAHVMVVSYTRPFEGDEYNPLPRDVVVRDNIFGEGGNDPAVPGSQEFAAMLGGSLPPILLDGATSYRVGGEVKTEPVRIVFDAPAATFGIRTAGDDRASGNPGMATSAEAEIAEPAPVQLPATQPGVDMSVAGTAESARAG